jgi:transcription initiation factor IIF auxiliary subunit
MTKRNTTKKPTPQAPSTINSTAPKQPVESVKAQTNTTASPKAKQAKTPAKSQKPTLASEVDRLRDDLVYANVQLSKAEAKIAEQRIEIKDLQDELYDNYYKSWWKFTYERFVDGLYSITKFFR